MICACYFLFKKILSKLPMKLFYRLQRLYFMLQPLYFISLYRIFEEKNYNLGIMEKIPLFIYIFLKISEIQYLNTYLY